MHDEPNIVEWAHFDPASFSCRFSDDLFGSLSDTSIVENLANAPSNVLLHEASHVMQIAATGAGLKVWGLAHNAIYLALAAAAATARNTDGTLPPGLFYLPAEIMHVGGEGPDLAHALRAACIFRDEFFGGRSVRIDDLQSATNRLQPYIVPGFATTKRLWPRGTGVRDEKLHILLPKGEGATEQISLGAIHLLEGQSAALEDLRILHEHDLSGTPEQASVNALVEAHERRPLDPYQIAWTLYERVARSVPEQPAASLIEFILLVDTALMLDRTGFDARGNRFDYSLPFDNFVSMIEAMRVDRSLHYIGFGEEVEFQNSLLKSLGVESTVMQLTEQLAAALQSTAAVVRDNLLEGLLPHEERAILHCIQIRRDFNGACPLVPLLLSDRTDIATFLSNTALLEIGSTQVPRNALQDDDLMEDWFNNFAVRHADRVASEILFGSIGCSALAYCRLPRRSACHGLTLSLSAYEDQCSREDLIARLAEWLDIHTISDYLRDVEFVDSEGNIRRMRR